MLIAERFVPPVAVLRRLDLPDDITVRAPGRTLDAVIMDEFGRHIRRARVNPPPAGMPGNRIDFAPIPAGSGTAFWFFVIDATSDRGAITPSLLHALQQRARALAGRQPIGLVWDATGAAADEAEGPDQPAITFAMLSEQPDPALLPRLDQRDIDPAKLTAEQRAWREDGVVILRQFLPDAILDPYIARRAQFDQPGGWSSPTPYMHVDELRALCLYPSLRRVLRELIGEEMMLHLNLTGWVSTERNWHQDDYLNPSFVNSWYAAVWIALDHIHPDSGPFEYIPRSHRWSLLRGDRVRAFMTPDELLGSAGPLAIDDWPKVSERFVVPAIEAEIKKRGATSERFLAEKGDVLIWHGRLLHRGSAPARSDLQRRAVIAHYSGVNHRPDMKKRKVDAQGGTYLVTDYPLM
jgi:hypothetical protein